MSKVRTPFVVLRGGKGNRHCGHRSRGTYALTHLTPPKQRTVLFGKCGVRPSAPLHCAQDDTREKNDRKENIRMTE
jgi:hypothetical protein